MRAPAFDPRLSGLASWLCVSLCNGLAGVFIDYCSLPQPAPRHAPQHLTRGVLPERTKPEERRFYYALSEMARLYAYDRCDVVVLKQNNL